jgi:hypothetical protein
MPGAAPCTFEVWLSSLARKGITSAGQGLHFSMELQDQKHGGKLIDRQSGLFLKLVDADGIVAEEFSEFVVVFIDFC